MSIAPQIRSAADALLARLTDDLRQHVAQAADDLAQTAEAAEAADAARTKELEAAIETRHREALETLRAEHAAALEAAQRAADAALAAARAEGDASKEALTAARAEVETLRADADAALAQAEAAVAQALAEATAQAEQSRAAALADSSSASEARTSARLSSLARAVTAMDEAGTLSDVLNALADGLAAQAPRTSVLVFRGEAARTWKQSGFGDSPKPSAELALSDHDDLRAIVESASPTFLEGGGDAQVLIGVTTLPAGETGLAVPVAIGGQVVALVYADGGAATAGKPTDAKAEDAAARPSGRLEPGWAELVEVLARHAARCLEALTAMRASGYARPQRPAVVVPMPPHLRIVERPTLDTSVGDAIEQAQRVARLLVSEIRLNREDDIREGRKAGDLGERLDHDVARARQQYLARVPEAVPGREALFEDEVIRTLAGGDARLLRRPTGS